MTKVIYGSESVNLINMATVSLNYVNCMNISAGSLDYGNRISMSLIHLLVVVKYVFLFSELWLRTL